MEMSALYFALLLLSEHVIDGITRSYEGTELATTPTVTSPLPERWRRRDKRGLLDLAGVVKCSTGRSAVAYIMYGCYCGLGGQGWPRDKADWCCHKHDCCYGKAEDLGCQTKTDKYQWTCENKMSNCESLKDRCDKILCRCDREAARCLRRAPFIPKYSVWPDFMCGYEQPTCPRH
ncbi:phospholipase A2 [Salmo salar]|uniref:Phospholipase A2 n=1 Tax=Salmo salar TaxID=8030 RepID=A0A1S3QKN8_SALSA|nr:phospholipase A2-like [Salmo salar]|eukprot:XP_014040595.1 PREDICTED: group 10 secretory phospholipase A2-like [Salmo salar]